ncbi:MAG: hypothetical protein ABJK59_04330 [Erythrobacter sp.]|uniref:hypothetical protein n=1 Tax=Erythrobacter sp. TaxID=1042 RepID=UPI003299154B
MMQRSYKIFADCFQFYLWDPGAQPDAPTDYAAIDNQNRLKVGENIVVVLPERNMTVPVTIELLDDEPELDPAQWDHIAEASLELPSGRLEIHECTGESIDVLSLGEGCYRVRVCFSGLHTLSENGLDGDDHYAISLWPAPYTHLSVIKQFER